MPARTQCASSRLKCSTRIRNVALFLAAPFIGLVYALALPLVGLAALAWIGGKALLQTEAAKKAPTFLKNVALLIAAPFIGLAYAVSLPFVGMGFPGLDRWQGTACDAGRERKRWSCWVMPPR